jgi:hypothetical protein
MRVDRGGPVVVDEWGLAMLLQGREPTSVDGTRFNEFVILERDYLYFLEQFVCRDFTTPLLEVLERVASAMKPRSRVLDSFAANLLGLEQILNLHGIPAGLARLGPQAVTSIPDVAATFDIARRDAERVVFLTVEKLPYLGCRVAITPRAWKAMFVNGVAFHDLQHRCPTTVGRSPTRPNP